MATPTATKPVEFVDLLIAVAGIVIFISVVLILAFVEIPKDNMQLFTVVVSFISGAWLGTVITNRFGSSKGSDEKTAALTDIAKTATE